MNDKLMAVLLAVGLVIYSKYDPSLLGANKEIIVGLIAYWFGKTLGVVNGKANGNGAA